MMRRWWWLLVLFVALQGAAQVLEGYREDSVMARMAVRPLRPVEGVWEVAGEGSRIAVELTQTAPERYSVVIVRGADPSLRPGTVMGWLTPAAARGAYAARIFTRRSDDGTLLLRPDSFTAQLDKDGAFLSIVPAGRKLRLNWWRMLLPYLYRQLVTPLEGTEPPEGFIRVYPAPDPPLTPRYL